MSYASSIENLPHTNGPNERFLRLSAVRERVPYSRATIYRMCSRGEFPRPYPLGAGAVAWLEREIDAWIQERISSTRVAEGR